VLGVFLNGEAILDETPHGERITDDSFLLLFNAWHEDMTFTLPVRRFGAAWTHELTTADPGVPPGDGRFAPRSEVRVTARSMSLLRRC
jgi:glycogen operon protein